MIKIIKEIKTDWYLIHLENTRYYQIWNKWELFDLLLSHKTTSAQHFWDEDFPMQYEDLEKIVDFLIEQKKQK
jgi:hypothetical protein